MRRGGGEESSLELQAWVKAGTFLFYSHLLLLFLLYHGINAEETRGAAREQFPRSSASAAGAARRGVKSSERC